MGEGESHACWTSRKPSAKRVLYGEPICGVVWETEAEWLMSCAEADPRSVVVFLFKIALPVFVCLAI